MFQVKTGVRLGCIMSAILFNMVIDWVMRTTNDKNRGIRWKIETVLEDLDFIDDIGLLSHTHEHMQEKTKHLSEIAKTISLNISETKTEIMNLNITNSTPIRVYDKDLPTTDRFTYLGSIVRSDGGACDDIKNRIAKARNTFIYY